jgi:hypothetical protein
MTRARAVNLVIFALVLAGTGITVASLGRAAPALAPLWIVVLSLLALGDTRR